jgi:putative restriction endonuclease
LIAVAPMDAGWFEQLSTGPYFPTVNFWTPTPWNVRQLKGGERLYWLYKAPVRKIAGFGSFLRYENQSIRSAWDEFGLANGVPSLEGLVSRTKHYVEKNTHRTEDLPNPTIGCIVLIDPVFLSPRNFIDPAAAGLSFPKQVVKHKYFTNDALAKLVHLPEPKASVFKLLDSEAKRAYKAVNEKDRPGQTQFRADVLNAYSESCCVFGKVPLEVLEAAHIQPYINVESNHRQNGLALRVDLHKLFDAGLIAIDDDFVILVSSKMDGTLYETLRGRKISLPQALEYAPSKEALAFHRRTRFRP